MKEVTYLGSHTAEDPLRTVVDDALCDAIIAGNWTITDLSALARWAKARISADLHELSLFKRHGTGWVRTKEASIADLKERDRKYGRTPS